MCNYKETLFFTYLKVWLDYKTYIKKKLSENRKNAVSTGGGPNKQKSFTPLEQSVIELLSLNVAVEGMMQIKSYGIDISNGTPSRKRSCAALLEEGAKENVETDCKYLL